MWYLRQFLAEQMEQMIHINAPDPAHLLGIMRGLVQNKDNPFA